MMSAQHIAAALMMNPLLAVVLIGLFVAVMLALNGRGRVTSSQRCHRRYRATAERVLQRLPQLAGDAQRLVYLRRINPYAFEELLLLALERQGHPVQRNASYSGDGGLDGQVFIDGHRWLIQAKRYGKTITPAHIRNFGTLLLRERCGGFFIHTGRTGNLSRLLLHAYPQVRLISGQRLLNLLAGDAAWLSSIPFPVKSGWSVSDASQF
ncbi:MAG: restriction endonuclease [Enterobacterales bacterium endosymbiont of Blomia tropicalis]|uniref:restriction endonuclease n=1 Tax=Mixta mediterraneensis TaxID=2758443 RepID=UPI0025A76B25|nr:restriction endonuclease [Mixta mediterraneensis]MDL4914904.1 restriction endonuclease [Mixta mediterraneensis]